MRLDDGFPEHEKILALSDRAFRLHVSALCYSARNLTDGKLTPAAVAHVHGSQKAVAELVAAGVWREKGGGSYLIHDYLEYNPSRKETEARRAKRIEAGRRGGIGRALRFGVAKQLNVLPGERVERPCANCGVSLTVDWTNPGRVLFLDEEGHPTPEFEDVDNPILLCSSCLAKT